MFTLVVVALVAATVAQAVKWDIRLILKSNQSPLFLFGKKNLN